MTYDPDLRRDTALARKLAARIRQSGPITVDAYMAACLGDPEHGYYVRWPAIGAGGDFITAPEISQVFGELIGLWSAVVWQQMGAPGVFNLVEIGPGRGTMMADALRATRLVPGFRAAVRVHLVENHPGLREVQRATLQAMGADATWHDQVATALGSEHTLSLAPTIVLANEYLDTQPIAQFVFSDGAWRERGVGLDAQGRLQFVVLADPVADSDAAFAPSATPTSMPAEGDIIEHSAAIAGFGRRILAPLARQAPLAALLIDYGHARAHAGDTLQALRGHAYEHPLTSPGEADLTAQVDFSSLLAVDDGVRSDGPVTQSQFLGGLGIVERASRLMAANPGEAGRIEQAVARLIAPGGMGSRFKVLGVRSAGLPPLPAL